EYPATRGPICFDCENVSDPRDCHTVTPCNLNQKCFIHEKSIFGKRYFTSKCESIMGCLPHFTGPVVGRRRDLSGLCIHCCDGDLCNSDCSTASNATVNNVNKPAMPDYVAFHAVAYSPTNNAVVIFDHVITNVGGGYDNTTGVFTVPTPGLYVFSWTIETYGQRTEAVLLVNGVQQALSRADQASSYYDTTTSFAVLKLSLGDEVKVKVTKGNALAKHTLFSGWKINKTEDAAFSVSLSREVTGSTIVFDNETLDTDSAYSTSTGRFVAPRSGLYVFMMSGSTYGNYEYSCKLYFSNGESQPDVWVDSASGLYDSSSLMSFGWLNAGEYVNSEASRMASHSVFAGWQLIDDSSVNKTTYPLFLAHLYSDSSRTPVVFSRIYSSYHHGYSGSTGIFTADRDGIYIFLYNIEANRGLVRTDLRVNGVEKFETRSDGRHSGYDDTSAVAVLELSSNDQVSVGVKYGTVDGGQSLFFGTLLAET
uniref:C1q domain-containing protein n=1 Tax=Magallana gigas TaxID=29159 RepID=A0A8W8I9T9_MAGGI